MGFPPVLLMVKSQQPEQYLGPQRLTPVTLAIVQWGIPLEFVSLMEIGLVLHHFAKVCTLNII